MSKLASIPASIVFAHLLAAPALAQEPTAAPAASAPPAAVAPSTPDSAPPGLGDDIVVTARRVTERAQDVPISISVLGPADLRNQVVRELRDVALQAPNVQLRQDVQDATGVRPTIRGQQQSETSLAVDGTVSIYVDGVNVPRLNGLRGALLDLARVEILRGPQGTLYGRNTTGGAISIVTADPEEELGGSLLGRYGRFDTYDVVGILNLPLAEGVGLRFVAQHQESDGYQRDFGGGPLADARGTYLRGKGKVERGGFTATLTGEYQKYRTSGPSIRLAGLTPATATQPEGGLATIQIAREAGISVPAAVALFRSFVGGSFRRSNGLVRPSFARFRGHRFGLTMEQELTDWLTLRSISGYQYFNRFQRLDSDGTPFAILLGPSGSRDRFYSQELQLIGETGPVSWVAGGYLSRERGVEATPTVALPALTGGRTTTQDGTLINKSRALFAQANWKITDQLTLTGGVRTTREVKTLISRNRSSAGCNVPVSLRDDPAICSARLSDTFSKPTWLASVDYKVVPDVLLYAKVSRGFRGGGQNLRGATETTFLPYDPEVVTEYEAGFKTELFDRRVRFNAAFFYDDYKDLQRQIIVIDPATLTTGTLTTNAAKARLYGLESELTIRATDQLTLNGSLGYLNGKYKQFVDVTGDRSGEEFPAPDWTASASARYVVPVAIGDVSLQVDYSWQSKQNLAPVAKNVAQVTQSAYGLLNARLALDLERQDATIAVFGRNINGAKFLANVISLESLGYNRATTGEPFTFGIELSKRF